MNTVMSLDFRKRYQFFPVRIKGKRQKARKGQLGRKQFLEFEKVLPSRASDAGNDPPVVARGSGRYSISEVARILQKPEKE